MGRVEKNQEMKQEVEKMKGEVVRSVKLGRRVGGRRMALGCSLLAGIVLVALLGAGLWIVAATGLVRVPAVSSVAYERPEPVREVRAGVALETFVNDRLTAELNRRLVAGGGELRDRSITLDIPEDAFTATLRGILEGSGVSWVDSSRAQVAISPAYGLSLFLPLADNPQDSAVRLRLVVTAEDGLLAYELREVRIGSLRLPAFLGDMLLGPVLDANLAEFNREIGRYAEMREIRYEEGSVTIDGEVRVDIIEIRR